MWPSIPKIPKLMSLHYFKNDMLQYLDFGMCTDLLIMGISSVICQLQTLVNDYFYLKSESRCQGSISNVFL